MKITFLGTSHGAPEKDRYCTSLLIEHAGYHYILDLGAPVEYLLKQQDISINTVKGIFITHMHADHAEALTSITKNYAVYNKHAEAELFLPEKEAIEPYKAWIQSLHMKLPEDRLMLRVIQPGVIFEKYGMRVTAVLTEHISKEVPTYAFIFEADGKKVLFTGDLAYDYHDYPAIVKNEEFDLVVSELVHLSIEKSRYILEGTKTKQMIFSHVGPGNVERLEKMGITFDFPYLIATDGFQYYVV